MGSCAAPSAKGDDKFITTDYLQQCRRQRLHHGEDLSAILISPSPPFWSLNACSG
ncbi:hypothetical protein ER11_004512 [Salmonella enterica subsp. enterica]|nr:hypothetical protein [Salmonella enterica subsp. enterica]